VNDEPTPQRAAIYARFSPQNMQRKRDEKAGSGSAAPDTNSAQRQIQACRDYCERHGLTITREHEFTDEMASGGTPLARRPGGKKLTEFLARFPCPVEHVVMTSLDRGWRDAVDCVVTTRRWTKRGITLHLVAEGGNSIDISTPIGRFVLKLLAATAELNRETISDRTKLAMHRYARLGMLTGRVIPYGWMFDPMSAKRKHFDHETGEYVEGDRHVGVVPDWNGEMVTVARILGLAAEGVSMNAIAKALTHDGVPCRGGKGWNAHTVKRIALRGLPDPESWPPPEGWPKARRRK
jgi:DNA invertase Pin-like site-specific DNA recombinase